MTLSASPSGSRRRSPASAAGFAYDGSLRLRAGAAHGAWDRARRRRALCRRRRRHLALDLASVDLDYRLRAGGDGADGDEPAPAPLRPGARGGGGEPWRVFLSEPPHGDFPLLLPAILARSGVHLREGFDNLSVAIFTHGFRDRPLPIELLALVQNTSSPLSRPSRAHRFCWPSSRSWQSPRLSASKRSTSESGGTA